jgi:uncharacterized protein
MIILSVFQAEPIIKAIKSHQTQVETSLDLNLSKVTLEIKGLNVVLSDGQKLSLKQLEKIAKKKQQCFLIEENEAKPINIYSETTDWMRTLYPTSGAPTTLVSGIHMHRIKDVEPWLDTKLKLEAAGRVNGLKVLDTTTGLGYTAIQAADKGAQVLTVEIDPAAIEIAKFNPWSQKLFDNPNIELKIADILELIKEFDNQFDVIIHDPPTFKLSGELYSEDFYRKLYKALKRGGRLFHYIGDPESEHGSLITKGVVSRLKQAGFSRIDFKPKAFGVLAT